MDRIITALFRRHPVRVNGNSQQQDCPLVAMKNFKETVLTMKNEVNELVFHHRPDLKLDAFNACQNKSVFPCGWIVARLVLISKEKGGGGVCIQTVV